MSIQNEILNAIASRRSCRAYKPEQITAEELEAVTTAGTWAATAMGRQSPVMVAVQDKETLAELSRLNAAVMGTKNDPFYGAPTAVLVLGEKNNPNGVQDASRACSDGANTWSRKLCFAKLFSRRPASHRSMPTPKIIRAAHSRPCGGRVCGCH